jgi:hypothetical protein
MRRTRTKRSRQPDPNKSNESAGPEQIAQVDDDKPKSRKRQVDDDKSSGRNEQKRRTRTKRTGRPDPHKANKGSNSVGPEQGAQGRHQGSGRQPGPPGRPEPQGSGGYQGRPGPPGCPAQGEQGEQGEQGVRPHIWGGPHWAYGIYGVGQPDRARGVRQADRSTFSRSARRSPSSTRTPVGVQLTQYKVLKAIIQRG